MSMGDGKPCTMHRCAGLHPDGTCPWGYDETRTCEATGVTLGTAARLEARGLYELADIARKHALDRPRWWHRFTGQAS